MEECVEDGGVGVLKVVWGCWKSCQYLAQWFEDATGTYCGVEKRRKSFVIRVRCLLLGEKKSRRGRG
jgi:hypothetical protein